MTELRAPPELVAAIADVRQNDHPSDYVLASYSADGSSLALVGCGTGGAEALAEQLEPGAIFYGLVRTTETIDATVAVKFVFVSFIGEGVPPKRRAVVATLKGAATEVFSPFHAEMINLTSSDELTSASVNALLGEMFGSALTTQAASGPRSMRIGQREVKMPDSATQAEKPLYSARQEVLAPGLAAAIASVRSNACSETDWCLAAWSADGSALECVGSGGGGAAALSAMLDPERISYGLVRVEDKVDQSDTIKFVHVSFLGERVSALRRAKCSTKKGSVTALFEPFHAEILNATSADEISPSAVAALVGNVVHGGAVGEARARSDGAAAMAQTAIGGRAAASKNETTVQRLGGATAFSTAAPEAAAVPQVVREAIADVRSDTAATSWALFSYEADSLKGSTRQPCLQVAGTGTGAAEEMAPLLDESQVMYALVRHSRSVDAHTSAVRFVVVSWLGPAVKPMLKAKLSVARGEALRSLSPYVVELLNVDSAADVSAVAITAALGSASAAC